MAKQKMPGGSRVRLPAELVSRLDDWAVLHGNARSEAARYLIELALKRDAAAGSNPKQGRDDHAIERLAEKQMDLLIDPDTSGEERVRRIHRLTEGPPEFVDLRRDLPRRKRLR